MMPPPRRKKWTEAEERTLIDKYGDMVREGTLAKMKTREKKYRPIASHLNSVHHIQDPLAFPWQWTWKDVSIKVQNMRHQYALVKQKVKKVDIGPDLAGMEEFDWMEGLAHWSNFLKYKEVFGDMPAVFSCSDSMTAIQECNDKLDFEGSGHGVDIVEFGDLGHPAVDEFAHGLDGVENEVMGLEFDYGGEEGEDTNNEFHRSTSFVKDDGVTEATGSDGRKKRKLLKGMEAKAWGFLAKQLVQLREMETRFEQREADRDGDRTRRESLSMEIEQERERKWEQRELEREEREKCRETSRRQRIQELEVMEKESEERERRRREEWLVYERESDEKRNRRICEWKKRMDDVLTQHQTEIGQIHARLLDEQQSLTSQLLGIVSQWTGHPTSLSDHTGASSHYLSQMMHNLHHVNELVHDDARDDGDNQEDQFIVDDV